MRATTDYDELRDADAILIALPTPLSKQREPDLSIVNAATEEIAKRLRKGHLVVLESTTYPGTTREELLPRLEASGLKVGEDFNLAFSPERVDPGSEDWTTKNVPKVVGGITEACTDRAAELYGSAVDTVHRVTSPESAELTKLLENIFRSVNIALVNELAQLCERMKIDFWEVVDAAATKPFGFMSFKPGPGLGGHCIPIDPFYLTWKAREYNFYTEFIELAGKVNENMPYYCRSLISQALNHGKQTLAEGLAGARARSRVQAGDQRRAREPGAEADRAAPGRRSRDLLPRPARARAPRASASRRSRSSRSASTASRSSPTTRRSTTRRSSTVTP